MTFTIVIFLAIIIVICSGFYYNILIKRIISLLTDKPKKFLKIFSVVLSAVLGIASINIFSIVGIILLHILASALVIELINLILKKINLKHWNRIYKSCILPVFMSLCVFTYGYFNIRNITETEYTIYTDKTISQNLKILMITDSHYGTIFTSNKLNELKSSLDSENADLVVLVGDIVDESTTSAQMSEVFETLGDINSKYGVYFVYGNHDNQNYSLNPEYSDEFLKKTIEDNGITILLDEYIEISDSFILAGRNDFSNGRDSVEDILKTADKNKFIIMLDHQPLDYDENVNSGTDLILSGHTHAGQIFPAGLFINILKTSDLCYGYEKINDMQAIVSSGIAGWGYPIRTEKHSEYVTIEIIKN